ncbi:MAG: hypothetical protein ABI311_10910 [Gemmatimonadaceae bacterium]
MKNSSWHLRASFACVVTGFLVTGCGKGGDKQATAAPPASTVSKPPAGATLAVAGKLLTGNDPNAIRGYLQTVKEIQPSKFEVKWNPATVAVDKDAAMRSLKAISQDGSDYTFDASEPVVATLKPGSILWIWDIAIRRVDSVATTGGVTVIHTSAIPVTQVWTTADIEFHAPVSLPNYYMAYRPHHPPEPKVASAPVAPSPYKFAAARSAESPRFASWVSPLGGNNQNGQGDPESPSNVDDWGEGTPATNGFNGEIKGFEYSLAYGMRTNGVSIILEAKKGDGGGGGGGAGEVAKKLFEIASDNLDVRFKAQADLDNFDVDGVLAVSNGDLDRASAQFKNLNGTVTMHFIGRMGDAGNGTIKLPLADVPVSFSLPIPIGGIPFVVQLGADFNLTLFLAGKNAAMKFDGKYSFDGSGGFTSDANSSKASTTISGGDPAVTGYAGMSPGVSGAVLGIQAPRVGLGIGLLGSSSMAYIDVVNVMTMTNSASVALGMGAPPCKRITYLTIGHVGVETNILPLPFPFIGDAINKKLSTTMPIFKSEKVVLDPPIKACEIN